MKVDFTFAKSAEKEKLLDIYDEYQWFLDNDFPIVLPKSYSKLYKEKANKIDFIKAILPELNKIYNRNTYIQKSNVAKENWRIIEPIFFEIITRLKLRPKDRYLCYISLYGPQGQFKCPNIVNLRIATKKDIKEINDTIAHELIHLLIFNKAKKEKLNYEQTETTVDSFFNNTDLKSIFPKYKPQTFTKATVGKHD